jgi:hypothetical protein
MERAVVEEELSLVLFLDARYRLDAAGAVGIGLKQIG